VKPVAVEVLADHYLDHRLPGWIAHERRGRVRAKAGIISVSEKASTILSVLWAHYPHLYPAPPIVAAAVRLFDGEVVTAVGPAERIGS
jgi:hypothetical protein